MTVQSEVVPTMVELTLGELFGLTDPDARQKKMMVQRPPSPMAPATDDSTFFRLEDIRRLALWWHGTAGRNLLIQGPTGCGKSMLIEQFCARNGRALYRVACHNRLEFSDMTGQMTIKQDGSTEFVHGPLVRAMREGGVLLLDEMNFLAPGAVGALNTVLDGGPLLIAETGEVVHPHPLFRVAATGNSVDRGEDAALYAGTQRMNLALIQRFLVMRVDYLSGLEEAQVLKKITKRLPIRVIEKMIQVAGDVRKTFANGGIETTLSSRIAVKWARVLDARAEVVFAKPEEEMAFALRFVLTDGCNKDDGDAIQGVLSRAAYGMKLSKDDVRQPKEEARPVKVNPASEQEGSIQAVHFLVNPNRQGSGKPAFWARVVDAKAPDALLPYYSGSLDGTQIRKHAANKSQAQLDSVQAEKIASRGYTVSSKAPLKVGHDCEAVIQEVVGVLIAVLNSGPNQSIACKTETTIMLVDDLSRQLGLNSAKLVLAP